MTVKYCSVAYTLLQKPVSHSVLVQSRFAETRFAETPTLTLTLTLTPNPNP